MANKTLMNKYTTLCIALLGMFFLSACDADDPSLDYTAQYYSVGKVNLSNSLTELQRTVIGRLLDNMVKVEALADSETVPFLRLSIPAACA